MKSLFACRFTFLVLAFSASAQTNEWTKSTSGNWEESYWSLGRLPGTDQQLVAINNDGWKAVAIGANTTASYPQSLSLRNLLIEARTNSSNQLLLNWAGLSVPLLVHSNLTIGTNGSLVSHYSALVASNAYIDGSASFSDSSMEQFDQLWLRPGAAVNLADGTMRSSDLILYESMFTQSGGTNLVQNIESAELVTNFPYSGLQGAYSLQGGLLISQQLTTALAYKAAPFWQSGGVHTNSGMTVLGSGDDGYHLTGGLLVSSSVVITNGTFTQSGGTNLTGEIQDHGHLQLDGGLLVTSNTTLIPDPRFYTVSFLQTGGTNIVQGRLLIQGISYYYTPPDQLSGGRLVVSNLEFANGGMLNVSSNGNLVTAHIAIAGGLSVSTQGTVSNSGVILVSGDSPASIATDGAAHPQYFGQLQLSSTCTLGYSAGATVRFADSHTLQWTGMLLINYPGPDSGGHIFFGSNSQALTAAQLDRIAFQWNGTNYPPTLLPTGEIIPLTTVNEWTKPTSGNWEESYWSLGRLPGMDQALVIFDNPGWKALAIDHNTTVNYPNSLSLHDLVIDGPTNSSNQLLLNWAGLSVPLNVHLDLTIGTNGSLESHYSALRAANAYIGGPASFSDYATEDFDRLYLRLGAALGLTNGLMTCSNLIFDRATFTQSGGSHVVQSIDLPENFTNDFSYSWPSAIYYLQGGTLTSQHLSLGSYSVFFPPNGQPEYSAHAGSFQQTGGFHTNSDMVLVGFSTIVGPETVGSYRLDGGVLISGAVDNQGSFSQNGGTNITRELRTQYEGSFSLSGGELVTSNASVSGGFTYPPFRQSGGTHTVKNQLLIESRYQLTGGKLATANIVIDQYGSLEISSEGSVSNAGILSLGGGGISADEITNPQYWGQLQTESGAFFAMHGSQPTNATVFRFADSHTLSWTNSLDIVGWGLNSGDHIFFGTNAQGLTAAQLAQVQFIDRAGKTSPAKLLGTGELVPAVPPPLGFINQNNSLVLSWPGGYELVSATNVSGPYLAVPGATSPFTNRFADPRRFFHLNLPSP